MYPSIRNLIRVSAVLATATLTVTAASAAGLLIADGGTGGVLEIKQQDVHVTINNGVAVTEIDQVFVNTENRVVEALYTFPVPKSASVSNFSMWIGGKEMIGEVVEKQRAREIYESYKQQRRDPGLLEQVDYKRFEMRIFPILAGAEQRVKLTYYQELDADHDRAKYVYPLATVSRNGINQKIQGRFGVTIDVKSQIPIVEMESPSHKTELAIAKHGDDYWRASMENSAGTIDRDVVLTYRVERPQTGFDVITSKTADDAGFFQLSLTAGKELEELGRGMDYVFLLDVSGSMGKDGKLPLSRQSLGSFIGALAPEDRFEVITFNIAPQTLFNSLREANETNLAEATTFLNSQRAVGGTVLRPAIDTAYRYQDSDRSLNVVVLSDGMTEQSEQAELIRLIKKRPSGCRVFCIGVGNEVNRPLLSQIADEAGGLAAFISQGDDFDRQAQAFRRKLMRPAAGNLQLTFSGGDVHDIEPVRIPDLYHGAPLRVYGRYSQSGPVTVTVKGDVQGQPFEKSVDVDFPKIDSANPEIERMWAWKRVDRLLGEMRQGENPSAISEVVKLCENYSIASEYASFIVLENDAEYQRWKIDRRNASRIARDRQAEAIVVTAMEKARNDSLVKLGPQDKSAPGVVTADALPAVVKEVERVATPQTSLPTPQSIPNTSRNPRNRSVDLHLPTGGSGGGAIDPISAAIGLGLTGAAAVAKRRRGNAASGDSQ